MATITKPNTFSAGAVIVASEHNDNDNTIYNDYNGNITNANIASNAAIADTKLAQLTTTGKVAGTALTFSSEAQGDIAYYNGTNWVRLAAGTDGQFLETNGSSANPSWTSFASGLPDGSIIGHQYSQTQTAGSDANANVTADTDSFLVTEGTQIFSVAITPQATTNVIRVRVIAQLTHGSTAAYAVLGLFNTDVHATNAVAVAAYRETGNNNGFGSTVLEYAALASALNGTSATTFTVRYGSNTGTVYLNQDSTSAKWGGALNTSIHIEEIKAS